VRIGHGPGKAADSAHTHKNMHKTQMLTYIYRTLKGVAQKENSVIICSPFDAKLEKLEI